MMHSPIQLQDIALSFTHKVCFESLTTEIHYGSRIGIIGQNGCGKSTLLKILHSNVAPSSGNIKIPNNVNAGYVSQVIDNDDVLSGGQRFNRALTQALSVSPNVLLLDEPTNHLDLDNRKSLMRMLNAFQGTLIMATHDVALLQNCVNTLWLIDEGQVKLFSGNYGDFMREIAIRRNAIAETIDSLHREKKVIHQALMKEQHRAAKSRKKGEKNIDKRKWPTIVSKAKANKASETSNRKKLNIQNKKQALCEQLSNLRQVEIINPTFSLCAHKMSDVMLVAIREGKVSYDDKVILDKVNLSMATHDRIAIMGSNGSGKTTLIKGILDNVTITKSGNWHVPKPHEIGYLGQHYETLTPSKSVLETIQELVPTWSISNLRNHLNDFLFHKNDEVYALVSTLSGGEKARLTLAQIAAKTPKLLILDEVTNNLDLRTRDYVIQVLQKYPGAMIVISHDEDFLRAINIQDAYIIENNFLVHSRLLPG